MKATLLHWQGVTSPTPEDTPGTWSTYQDPITGEIRNVWVPAPDDPNAPDVIESEFPCMARAIILTGMRAQGSGQQFGATYENIEIVHMWVPADVAIHKDDRITNIKDKNGHILWNDYNAQRVLVKPTIFNVNGVSPIVDPFNRHVETFVVLERAQDNATG